jgi:hypothetical protein
MCLLGIPTRSRVEKIEAKAPVVQVTPVVKGPVVRELPLEKLIARHGGIRRNLVKTTQENPYVERTGYISAANGENGWFCVFDRSRRDGDPR